MMDFIEKLSLKLVDKYKACSNSHEVSSILKQHLEDVEHSEVCVNPSLPFDRDEIWINTNPLTKSQISGKIVLLDFFTYCCINCIHIIPFLHKIEAKYSSTDGLLVIGVHSAKFPNEKITSNITHALKRYEIQHAVINDFTLDLWNAYAVKCWPTLVVLNPRGEVILSLPGETHTDVVQALISEAMNYYGDSLNTNEVIPTPKQDEIDSSNQLKFPGKIALDLTGTKVAIADTGNNRILICTVDGVVLHSIGNGKVGRQDGDYTSCSFNTPQGVAWHGANSIFIADCDNHLIRKVDLLVERVVTVAGTGDRGNDHEGGRKGTEQVICSPWDVVIAGSPRFPDDHSILYIAMSGIHQIWAFFLRNADWQKGSEYEMETCLRMAGSGQEENRNNSYPHKAGLAQPSGICVDKKAPRLFVADSESSTIRQIKLTNGAVEALVGGHFDPTNLFAFGDEDGKARNAKLQHPLAVAWDWKRSMVYVADSYNHKIKMVDPSTKVCVTLCGPLECAVEADPSLDLAPKFDAVDLNEPGGLCMDSECEHLYIADTNNHQIKVLTLASGECRSLQVHLSEGLTVTDSVPVSKVNDYLPLVNRKRAKHRSFGPLVVGNKSILHLAFRVDDLHLTNDAPSSWQLSASLSNGGCEEVVLIDSGSLRSSDADLALKVSVSDLLSSTPLIISKLPCSNKVAIDLALEALLYYCRDDSQLCTMTELVATLSVSVENPTSHSSVVDMLFSSADLS